MRTASILPALVVVLGFVSEAGAYSSVGIDHKYTIEIAGQTFGFMDGDAVHDSGEAWLYSWIYFGPLGSINSPFTATQGLVGFCVIVVGLLAMVTVGTMRWKRKRAV
jgi:hypothetical protein